MAVNPKTSHEGGETPQLTEVPRGTWIDYPSYKLEDYRQDVETGLDAIGNAQLANHFWESYLAGRHPQDRNLAMAHYDSSLSQAAGEPALQTWVMCNRLNPLLSQLETGHITVDVVIEELNQALASAKEVSFLEHTGFRLHSIRWLKARIHELTPLPTTEADMPTLVVEDLGNVAVVGTQAVLEPNILF
jgi:hypothetical protein